MPSSQDVLTPQPDWLCLYVLAKERQTEKSSSPWQALFVCSLETILPMAARFKRGGHHELSCIEVRFRLHHGAFPSNLRRWRTISGVLSI